MTPSPKASTLPDQTPAGAADSDAAASHEGEIDIGHQVATGASDAWGKLVARFVRYPGCQQLSLWLPQPGHRGYTEVRIVHADGSCIDRAAVGARLSGSVQMRWDTLAWPPGAYRVEVAHVDGWCHRLPLHKRRPDEVVPVLVDDTPVPRDSDGDKLLRSPSGDIIYRDGFGRVLPDLDLQMRAEANAALLRQFSGVGLAQLEYSGNFRGGTVTYVEGGLRIDFLHDMGGGGCKLYVEIPLAQHWEAVTHTPLARRDEIVAFVALNMQREQCRGWHFEIQPDQIRFT